MEAQAIAPAMYEWNDATFPACIAVAIALASITTNKDFNEAALAHRFESSLNTMFFDIT